MSGGPHEPRLDTRLIAAITDTVADRVARGDASPAALLFLMRRYTATGRDDLRRGVEHALAHGLAVVDAEPEAGQRCAWLAVFAEAAAFTDDGRLMEAVRRVAPAAIEDLEHAVRERYEPGEGLRGASLFDQVSAALALFAAFDVSGRLAYPMLAEELMRAAGRDAWEDERGALRGGVGEHVVAARVLFRLEALHRDPDYTASVTVPDEGALLHHASRMLDAVVDRLDDHPRWAADFGLAWLDRFAFSAHPN